jgi:hypothetical protein
MPEVGNHNVIGWHCDHDQLVNHAATTAASTEATCVHMFVACGTACVVPCSRLRQYTLRAGWVVYLTCLTSASAFDASCLCFLGGCCCMLCGVACWSMMVLWYALPALLGSRLTHVVWPCSSWWLQASCSSHVAVDGASLSRVRLACVHTGSMCLVVMYSAWQRAMVVSGHCISYVSCTACKHEWRLHCAPTFDACFLRVCMLRTDCTCLLSVTVSFCMCSALDSQHPPGFICTMLVAGE